MTKVKNQLLIFTKNPIPGRVKTRIGNIKGHDIAVKIYKTLLLHTMKITTALEDVKLKVFFNDTIEGDEIWPSTIFKKELQVSGNLGIKMSHAFQNALPSAEKVILIGSDCAALSEQHLKEAFESLEDHDIVLGPALDGGYYLIGMRTFHPEMFDNMPWSESNLLEETRIRIDDLGIKAYFLEALSDIDFWEDWVNLGWEFDN